MKVSIVITTACRKSLRSTLEGLARQRAKPDEVLLVHSCDKSFLTEVIEGFEKPLNVQAAPQEGLGIPGAVNTAIRRFEGDVAIFIDDDAIPPRPWVGRYVEALDALGEEYAGVSSRDVLFEPSGALLRGPDERPLVRLYRWFFALPLRKPLPILKDYRLGVYVDRKYSIAHGPCIPYSSCLSLPLRGANMAFRRQALDGAELPELPGWARGTGYEQYLGLLAVLRGYKYAYIPSNPILHLARGGVSRIKIDERVAALERALVAQILRESVNRYVGYVARARRSSTND